MEQRWKHICVGICDEGGDFACGVDLRSSQLTGRGHDRSHPSGKDRGVPTVRFYSRLIEHRPDRTLIPVRVRTHRSCAPLIGCRALSACRAAEPSAKPTLEEGRAAPTPHAAAIDLEHRGADAAVLDAAVLDDTLRARRKELVEVPQLIEVCVDATSGMLAFRVNDGALLRAPVRFKPGTQLRPWARLFHPNESLELVPQSFTLAATDGAWADVEASAASWTKWADWHLEEVWNPDAGGRDGKDSTWYQQAA